MFITKSEELHMELVANRIEAQAATREHKDGLVDYQYASAALNMWADALDRWEENNTCSHVSLERECIKWACRDTARRWVAGRYDNGDAGGFTACRKHAEELVINMDAHFLTRRVDFLEDVRMEEYYRLTEMLDGGEY